MPARWVRHYELPSPPPPRGFPLLRTDFCLYEIRGPRVTRRLHARRGQATRTYHPLRQPLTDSALCPCHEPFAGLMAAMGCRGARLAQHGIALPGGGSPRPRARSRPLRRRTTIRRWDATLVRSGGPPGISPSPASWRRIRRRLAPRGRPRSWGLLPWRCAKAIASCESIARRKRARAPHRAAIGEPCAPRGRRAPPHHANFGLNASALG